MEMMQEVRVHSASLRLPLGPRDGASSVRAAGVVACLVVAGAVAVAVGPWAAWIRALLTVGLVVLAGWLHRVIARMRRPPHGWLVVDDQGVRRLGLPDESMVVDWQEPFGATVLSSGDRATFLVAFTAPGGVRYVSARVTDAEDAASAPTVIDRATTAADSDLRIGNAASLKAADAEKLLSEIARRAPAALDRAYLSDVDGEPVVLEPAELRVGGRRIDMRAPLEWRAMIFFEQGVGTVSVSQGTWVRQGGVEVVLVAPLPADGVWLRSTHLAVRAAGEGRAVKRAIERDIRLMQAAFSEPPPRELRRAIDRIFMLPLRRALDGAPRTQVEVDRVRPQRSPRATQP
jgi:hypothetical protein